MHFVISVPLTIISYSIYLRCRGRNMTCRVDFDYRQTTRQFPLDANQPTASGKSTRPVRIIWINDDENARADSSKNRNACQFVIITETSVGVWPGR